MQHFATKVYTSPSRKHWIDFLFVSQSWIRSTKSIIMPSITGSDHHCPTITICTESTINGKGYWQLSCWLAKHAAFFCRPEQQKYANLACGQQPKQLEKLIKRLTKSCRSLHNKIIHKRQNCITKASTLWRKWHLATMQIPAPFLVVDAVATRKSWLHFIEYAKRRNKAAVLDQHFDRYKSRSREFFKQR